MEKRNGRKRRKCRRRRKKRIRSRSSRKRKRTWKGKGKRSRKTKEGEGEAAYFSRLCTTTCGIPHMLLHRNVEICPGLRPTPGVA